MVGNIANYSNIDIIRAILYIIKPISRSALVKRLELGEGTVRTILDILKKNKLLVSTKKGHFLTEKGKKIAHKLRSYIISVKPINSKQFYPAHKKIALLLRNIRNPKINAMLRDTAVKNNADGALILIYQGGLRFPKINYNIGFKTLEKEFALRNGDILIIGFAGRNRDAENGALAIALKLCKDINTINIRK